MLSCQFIVPILVWDCRALIASPDCASLALWTVGSKKTEVAALICSPKNVAASIKRAIGASQALRWGGGNSSATPLVGLIAHVGLISIRLYNFILKSSQGLIPWAFAVSNWP